MLEKKFRYLIIFTPAYNLDFTFKTTNSTSRKLSTFCSTNIHTVCLQLFYTVSLYFIRTVQEIRTTLSTKYTHTLQQYKVFINEKKSRFECANILGSFHFVSLILATFMRDKCRHSREIVLLNHTDAAIGNDDKPLLQIKPPMRAHLYTRKSALFLRRKSAYFHVNSSKKEEYTR